MRKLTMLAFITNLTAALLAVWVSPLAAGFHALVAAAILVVLLAQKPTRYRRRGRLQQHTDT